MAKVVYTCFSVPPEGILIGKVYETGKDEKGYFYVDNQVKIYCEEEYINTLFSPIEESKAKEVENKQSTAKEQKKFK